ncbi:thiolase family protein [Amaricoccus solimangrovi]|uniref:Thiolase family protein n=1 Tax=Amaricoccus solimangrovi TaxID=2589815 RepID=A0A501WQJ8_9RHOB|nr:thiolase family protein [Amaricoccus solimangrovi]TPE51628.1 thiolase family protein [Amaricoccus solimangrovi]
MTGPVIVGARRLAVVPRGGGFRLLEIHQLAAPVIAALLEDAGLGREAVDEVILANALGGGGNPARLAALAAGLPERVGGLSVDRQCVGGMDAILLADALIRAGRHEVIAAGGAESYSRRPSRLRTDPGGGEAVPYDQPPFTPWPDRDPGMAEAAGALAERLGISREEQDAWAIASHARALAAAPRLPAEIVPLSGIEADPFARRITARICARAPVLAGGVTTANTAVAADGAAFCLLVSDRIARRLSTPRLRVLAGATLGADPALPGLAPVPAIRAVLEETGLEPAVFAAVELMEAFAVQAIACARLAGLPAARVNRGGGALARGHPIGASGAINLTRLVHELGPGESGLAAIAAAGGLGTAVALERLA